MSDAPILAVAFDLDGLMFDSEALFVRVTNTFLMERGKSFTSELMRMMIGRRADESYPALKRMAGLDESPEELLTQIRARFTHEIDTAIHPTPGLFALLAHLKHRGIPRAVTTSSRRAYAERLLIGHEILDQFTFLLTSEDVTKGKPDPEIYLKAAQRFGVEPANLLVLEDSPPGLAAARAAGAFAVGVPHEHSPAEALTDAHLIVPSLDDPALLAKIDGTNSRPERNASS